MKRLIQWFLLLGLIVNAGLLRAGEMAGYEFYKRLQPKQILVQDGTLLLSNSPETVKQTGVLYQDQIKGSGRLLFHHVNQTENAEKKLVIVADNMTEKYQMLRVYRKATIRPDYHYLRAGEEVLKAYFHNTLEQVYFLAPHERIVLYDSKGTNWPVQSVQSGMMDLEVEDDLRITFAMLERNEPIHAIDHLEGLDKDMAPRGTFECLTKYQYVLLPSDGKAYYLIEEDEEDWMQGKDALTEERAINYGNYGIMYKITLMAMADTEVFICPRGGIFQGMVRWDDGQICYIKRPHVFKVNKERIPIGKLKQGEVKTLEYFLPNGSAAPVLFGFEISK